MLADDARALFEANTPYPGPALPHHNQRIAAFTLALAERAGLAVDEDLVRAGCWVHDIGLLIPDRRDPSYLRRGWAFVEPRARCWGCKGDRLATLRDVLLYNHALRPVPGAAPTAELVRRAVQVEHSLGRVRHGLERARVREIRRRWPRAGLTRVLLSFARTTLFEDGPKQLGPMFFPTPAG